MQIESGTRWCKIDFHAHSLKSFDFCADEGKRATTVTQ
jgi:hypothetical protein